MGPMITWSNTRNTSNSKNKVAVNRFKLTTTFSMLAYYMLEYPLSVNLLDLQMHTSVNDPTSNDNASVRPLLKYIAKG